MVAASLLASALPLFSSPAAALEPPLAFTAAALPTYQTDGVAWTLAESNGLVFVGGSFTSLRPPGTSAGSPESVPRTNFAVLDAATGRPTGCAPAFTASGAAEAATVRALEVSPDGRTLYVGGFFSSAGGQLTQHLVALDIASCSVRTDFRPLPNGTVRAIDATGTAVFYGGSLTSVRDEPRSRAAAAAAVGADAPGALLPWAPAFDKDVRAIALKPDRSVVVVGGDFDSVNGVPGHALTVVDPQGGATVHAFPTNLFPAASVVKAIAVDQSGFYLGNEGTGFQVFDGRTAMNWDYTERWRDTCLGATQALLVHAGLLYSASHAHDCSTMGAFPDGPRLHFLAQRVEGPELLPWYPNTNEGIGEGIGPRAVTVASTASGDVLWSAGEFTTVNGVPQQGLTRFGQTDHSSGPSGPTLSVTSVRPNQVRVTWRQSFDMDDGTLTYRVYRDRGTTPVHTATGTAPFWSRRQMTFIDNQPAGSTHSYRVTVSDRHNTTASAERSTVVAGTTSSYAERVAADGAILHWRYDELSDVLVADTSSSGSNGTLRGGATHQINPGAVAGDPSRALSLPGTSGTIYSEQAFPKPSAYTLETWFRTTTTAGGKIIGFGDKQVLPSRVYDKMIYMTNAGTLVFGAGSGHSLVSPQPYNDGAWHHVAATQGADGMALHVDGVRVGRNSNAASQNNTPYLRVGGDTLTSKQWPSLPSSQHFAGALDETAVYPTALSASVIADHVRIAGGSTPPLPADYYGRAVLEDDPSTYWRVGEASGTVAADTTGAGGVPGTYSGGVTHGVAALVAGTADSAVTLDGQTGLVAASQARAGTTSFSAEVWLRTSTTRGGQVLGFGSSASGDSTTTDRTLYLRDDGRLSFGMRSGSTLTTITSAAAYNDGKAHHVAVTKSSAGMALYVDGARVATSTTTAAKSNASTASGYWRLGGDALTGWPTAPTSKHVAATVDELAVYPRALTATEVAAHHSGGTPGGADLAPPTVAAAVTAGVDAGAVQLSWEKSLDDVGVVAYDVHRSASPGFAPTASTALTTVAGVEAVDPGPGAGTWYYRVVARDAAGNASDPSNIVSAFVTDTTAPGAVVDLAVTASSSSAELTWSPSSDDVAVTDYLIYRSTTSGFTPTADNQVAAAQETRHVDERLASGDYFYRVQARDAAGNLGPFSTEVLAQVKDVAAPTVPAGVSVTVAGSTVGVDWTASTDDVSVARYEVHRSSTAGATPSASTLVGTPTGTSFTEADVPAGTWYYRVLAVDTSGNRSEPSTDQLAEVAEQPAVQALAPVADAYVNEGAQDTNYGTTSSLWSRGSLGYVSYLRFALPAAPQGQVLSSAVLRLRTTGDTIAGSADAHAVRVAQEEWTETGVTWRNRPASSASSLGAVAAGTVPSTTYETALDVQQLGTLLGTTRTLAVGSTGTDNLAFWSNNHPTASVRPQLVLTFTAADSTEPSPSPTPEPSPSPTPEPTPEPSPTPTTVDLVPTADTYANEGAPGTNYGTTSSLWSRGSLGYVSYLRFELPAAPEGLTLKGAELHFLTTSDSVAGSADRHEIRGVLADWSETVVTWRDRPALDGPLLGAVAAGTSPSTRVVTPLDVDALRGTGATSLAVTSAGTDNLAFWSKDHPSAASRPVLRLLYG